MTHPPVSVVWIRLPGQFGLSSPNVFMSPELQTIAALVIVAVTVGLLIRSALKKRAEKGCGSGCGCPTADFKAKLKQR